MDPDTIIQSIQARLTVVAGDPPFIEDPCPARAAARIAHGKTFVGYPEAEIAAAERALGVRFPAVFRTFLLRMGRHPGDLFRGSDLASLDSILKFRDEAIALMGDAAHELPPRAIVFLTHQGYQFLFFNADGGIDAPIFQFVEGDVKPRQICETFEELVNSELALMEHNRDRTNSSSP